MPNCLYYFAVFAMNTSKKQSISNKLYFIMAITIVVSIHFNLFYYICLLQLS